MAETVTVYEPRIPVELLPPTEQEAGWMINALLRNLNYHLHAFGAAVSLYEHASELYKQPVAGSDPPSDLYSDVHDSWRRIAGRDGALTLYHFKRTYEGLFPSLRQCDSVAKLFDKKLLKRGTQLFADRFPDAIHFRHAVAHMADVAAHKDGFLSNAFSGDYRGPPQGGLSLKGVKNVMVWDYFQGDHFTVTFEKKILTYAVNVESYDHVKRAVRTIWNAFAAPSVILGLSEDRARNPPKIKFPDE